jgi:hypothetical protein
MHCNVKWPEGNLHTDDLPMVLDIDFETTTATMLQPMPVAFQVTTTAEDVITHLDHLSLKNP